MTQAEIITIGDEILIGQIVDSNSAFIAQKFNEIGIEIGQITSISDDVHHIELALSQAQTRSNVVIITGGLGPTKDDVTKQAMCNYFKDTLREDTRVLAHIEHLFKKYISTPISEMNRQQALVPTKASVLQNDYGTAPGLHFIKEDTHFFFLPGVPFEMKNLIKQEVIPVVKRSYNRGFIVHRTLMTYGLGESAIAERIAQWEDALPKEIKLAYLPSLGSVRLRLSARGNDESYLNKILQEHIDTLIPLIADILYGEQNGQRLEENLGQLLIQKNMTIATAESLTGGGLALAISSVPGASAYFMGSVIAYATLLKIQLLGVSEVLIDQESVVSARVAEEMATGLRKRMGVDIAVSTTGNAGPEKGDSEAAIGTVFIGIASDKGVFSHKFSMGNHRERVVQKTINKALELAFAEVVKF